MSSTFWLPGSLNLVYLQYCKSLHLSGQIHRPLTAFEEMCGFRFLDLNDPWSTSRFSHKHVALPTYTRTWSEDLGIETSQSNWRTSFIFTLKTSISSFIQEKKYKLLSWWYRDLAIRSSQTHLMSARVVKVWEEPFCMFGENVISFPPFGSGFSRFTIKCMITHSPPPLKLLSYRCFRAQLNPRNWTFSGSLWQRRDTS